MTQKQIEIVTETYECTVQSAANKVCGQTGGRWYRNDQDAPGLEDRCPDHSHWN